MEDNSTQSQSEPGRKRGLNSPFGLEGSICAQFHFSPEYVQWGITWVRLQIMLADMPWYDYSNSKKQSFKTTISIDSFESPEDLRKYLETMND